MSHAKHVSCKYLYNCRSTLYFVSQTFCSSSANFIYSKDKSQMYQTPHIWEWIKTVSWLFITVNLVQCLKKESTTSVNSKVHKSGIQTFVIQETSHFCCWGNWMQMNSEHVFSTIINRYIWAVQYAFQPAKITNFVPNS